MANGINEHIKKAPNKNNDSHTSIKFIPPQYALLNPNNVHPNAPPL